MAISGGDAQAPAYAMTRPAPTLGWFLKRFLVGTAILLVAMGGLAWLTYASIDPALDGIPAPSADATHAPAAL
mgnify:CR=1 FL=1